MSADLGHGDTLGRQRHSQLGRALGRRVHQQRAVVRGHARDPPEATQQPGRARYLLAKLAALVLALAAGIALTLVAGALLGLVLGGLLGQRGALRPADLLALPVGLLRALLVLLPYVLLTVSSAIAGRSVLAGAAGGFLFLMLDVGLGALSALGRLGGVLAFLVSLVLQPNINTLVVQNSRSFGLDPAALTPSLGLAGLHSPLHALLVILGWSALFGLAAYRALARRDITGAA